MPHQWCTTGSLIIREEIEAVRQFPIFLRFFEISRIFL